MARAQALWREGFDLACTFKRRDVSDHGCALGAHARCEIGDGGILQIVELHQKRGLSGSDAGSVQIGTVMTGKRAICGAGRLGHAHVRAVAEVFQQRDLVCLVRQHDACPALIF